MHQFATETKQRWKGEFAASGGPQTVTKAVDLNRLYDVPSTLTTRPQILSAARSKARLTLHQTRRSARKRYDEDVARRKPPADDPKTDFSRPLPQHEYPLRTSLMDRTACNIRKHRTRAGLLNTMQKFNVPHKSYDIDGDGVVSVEDYRMAKQFDGDGNGYIDASEKAAGRDIIAQDIMEFHEEVRGYMGKIPKSGTALSAEKARLAAQPNLSQILWQTRKERNVFTSKSGKNVVRLIYPSRRREFNTTNSGGRRPESLEIPCDAGAAGNTLPGGMMRDTTKFNITNSGSSTGRGMTRSCESLTELRATRRLNLYKANASGAEMKFETPARCPKSGAITKHGQYGFLHKTVDKGMADTLYNHRPRAMFDQSTKKLQLL